MDKKLRNLKRLCATDPSVKDRYIRELERLVGIEDLANEAKMKCFVKPCPNHAHQGHGVFIITQANIPGQPPAVWDEAVGPMFICGPCYRRLREGWTRLDYNRNP